MLSYKDLFGNSVVINERIVNVKWLLKSLFVFFLTVDLEIPNIDGGILLSVGMGDVGQLGLGIDVEEKTRPAVVSDVKDVVALAAGGLHTVCLNKDGKASFSFEEKLSLIAGWLLSFFISLYSNENYLWIFIIEIKEKF